MTRQKEIITVDVLVEFSDHLKANITHFMKIWLPSSIILVIINKRIMNSRFDPLSISLLISIPIIIYELYTAFKFLKQADDTVAKLFNQDINYIESSIDPAELKPSDNGFKLVDTSLPFIAKDLKKLKFKNLDPVDRLILSSIMKESKGMYITKDSIEDNVKIRLKILPNNKKDAKDKDEKIYADYIIRSNKDKHLSNHELNNIQYSKIKRHGSGFKII